MEDDRLAGVSHFIEHLFFKGTRTRPSPKDIALAHYSEAIHFIVTPRPYATTPVRAFSIQDRRVTELEIQVLP